MSNCGVAFCYHISNLAIELANSLTIASTTFVVIFITKQIRVYRFFKNLEL